MAVSLTGSSHDGTCPPSFLRLEIPSSTPCHQILMWSKLANWWSAERHGPRNMNLRTSAVHLFSYIVSTHLSAKHLSLIPHLQLATRLHLENTSKIWLCLSTALPPPCSEHARSHVAWHSSLLRGFLYGPPVSSPHRSQCYCLP